MTGIRPIGYSGGIAAVRRQGIYAFRIASARAAAIDPARPGRPVEPVSPVRRVLPDVPVRTPIPSAAQSSEAPDKPQARRVPTEEDLNNAHEHLARMRIRYMDEAENDSFPLTLI